MNRKSWKLYTHITLSTIKQLEAANIEISKEIEHQTVNLDYRYSSYQGPSIIKNYKIILYTKTEKQETLLALLFNPDQYQLEEISNERDYFKEFITST